MGLFNRKNTQADIDRVVNRIEDTDDRYSGLVRHYNHQGVRDSVKQRMHVILNDDEVEQVIGQVWCDNGCENEPITHLDKSSKPSIWQRLTGNY